MNNWLWERETNEELHPSKSTTECNSYKSVTLPQVGEQSQPMLQNMLQSSKSQQMHACFYKETSYEVIVVYFQSSYTTSADNIESNGCRVL